MGRIVTRKLSLFAIFSGITFGLTQLSYANESLPSAYPNMKLIFSDEFADTTTIAESPRQNAKAKWFRARFFAEPTTPSSMVSVQNGKLTLTGSVDQGASIMTAAPFDNADGWKGRVFRNGFYAEARIAVGNDALATPSSWPAFWAMAVEHMALRGAAKWPGQPPEFMRFIETDIFEYHPLWSKDGYYVTMWEWFGKWQQCKKGRWCDQSNTNDSTRQIYLRNGKKFTDFQVYGQYWLPATPNSTGMIQNYLNGDPVGPLITWKKGEASPPASGKLLFNVIDRQGLVVILSTGGQPMSVDWVRIWQSPSGVMETR
jgi:hypothetical protein